MLSSARLTPRPKLCVLVVLLFQLSHPDSSLLHHVDLAVDRNVPHVRQAWSRRRRDHAVREVAGSLALGSKSTRLHGVVSRKSVAHLVATSAQCFYKVGASCTSLFLVTLVVTDDWLPCVLRTPLKTEMRHSPLRICLACSPSSSAASQDASASASGLPLIFSRNSTR